MHLLVEYSILDGKAPEQVEALRTFVDGLKSLSDDGFHYTAFETDDPTKFIAIAEFEDDAAKKRFLDSPAFSAYREGSKGRFQAPPTPTNLRLVASTKG